MQAGVRIFILALTICHPGHWCKFPPLNERFSPYKSIRDHLTQKAYDESLYGQSTLGLTVTVFSIDLDLFFFKQNPNGTQFCHFES